MHPGKGCSVKKTLKFVVMAQINYISEIYRVLALLKYVIYWHIVLPVQYLFFFMEGFFTLIPRKTPFYENRFGVCSGVCSFSKLFVILLIQTRQLMP